MRNLGLIFLFLSAPAHATLGERVSQNRAKAIVRSVAAYTVHETRDALGTIREYVSSAGVVFAVTWSGVAHPNLSDLLGEHYSEYQSTSEAQGRVPGVRNRSVAGSRVVVEQWGHQRKLQGRALDLTAFPVGVSENEIH